MRDYEAGATLPVVNDADAKTAPSPGYCATVPMHIPCITCRGIGAPSWKEQALLEQGLRSLAIPINSQEKMDTLLIASERDTDLGG